MKKSLYDLTRDDWNTLFPVQLVEHDARWKTLYREEEQRIAEKIGRDIIIRIEHFGSTSIPGIMAKPYIDIIIEIPENLLFDEELIGNFEELGYTHFKVPERNGIDAYMSFGKGYNLNGKKEQIYHIHMCPGENAMWKQVDFRDYLIANPDRARAYERLKTELASKFSNDRGGYVLAKTDFVNETLEMMEKYGQ